MSAITAGSVWRLRVPQQQQAEPSPLLWPSLYGFRASGVSPLVDTAQGGSQVTAATMAVVTANAPNCFCRASAKD
jgi:hypothetical protein